MPRISIMLFSHICYTDHITGAEKLLLMQLRELGRMHDCTLVVPNEGILSTETRKLGIDTVVLHYPITDALWEPDANTQQKLAATLTMNHMKPLIDLLLVRQPDLVFTLACVNPLPAVTAKQLGIPVVWCVTETLHENAWTDDAVRFIDSQSDWIVGISERILAPFVRNGLSGKTEVLYPSWNGARRRADVEALYRRTLRDNLGLSEEEPLIAFIASDLTPLKGLEHFIFMAVVLSQSLPSAKFLIVGNPTVRTYFESCIENIRHSGSAHRFFVAPFTKRIEAVLPAVDVLVMTSLIDEGFGMTALEAMLFERAVAAYASGGLSELLGATGNNDHLAPKGDAFALAGIVGILASDAGYRSQIASRSRTEAERVFGIDAYRERLKRFMSRISEQAAASRQAREASLPPGWPNGILAMGDSDAVFWLEGGRKRPIASQHSFAFFGFRRERIVVTDHQVLSRFPTGRAISQEQGRPEYAPERFLAKAQDGSLFAVTEGRRHRVVSPALLQTIASAAAEAAHLPDAYLSLFPEGEAIGEEAFMRGRLIDYMIYADPGGGLWYAEDGKLRPIPDHSSVYVYGLRNEFVIRLKEQEMAAFERAQPVLG